VQDGQHAPAAAEFADPAQPLAVFGVKGGNRGAAAEPQDMLEPVRLRRVERDGGIRRQPLGEVEAGCRALRQLRLRSRE
jgi:hypothetical protein